MSILNGIFVENFLGFRDRQDFSFLQGNYLIGRNNAGKTAILTAIRFFFDEKKFDDPSFLNKTEFARKKGGFNRSTIGVTFNLNALKNNRLKRDLKKMTGSDSLQIIMEATYKVSTGAIDILYRVASSTRGHSFDDLDKDIKQVLKGVKINYIHPQEGKDLLKNAQEKLRSRLLSNWGRAPGVTGQLKDLDETWNDSRNVSNAYLSSSVTDAIQEMWPGGKASVSLPETIRDILRISEINFQADSLLPEVSLPAQGSGAQQSVLYVTHFLLDSDRTLHKGEYHPIWLLEEPESFLHADLISKLGNLLSSDSWLDNIQMFISTHSPIILATSKRSEEKSSWIHVDNHLKITNKKVKEWSEIEIREIGKIMGDSNFYAYFAASQNQKLVFLEDTKLVTTDAFERLGIKVTKGLRGVPEVEKFIDVYSAAPFLVTNGAYFVIDADKGLRSLSSYVIPANESKTLNGFKKYKVVENVFIIVLPAGSAIEGLFDDYEPFLDKCLGEIYDLSKWQLKACPPHYSRVVSELRAKNPGTPDDAKNILRNQQDIKDPFWQKVDSEKLVFSETSSSSLKELLDM